jgi:hypothetical protein
MSGRERRTLKLVIAWSERRNLCTLVEDALAALAGEDDVRRLTEDSCLVWTTETTEAVRDTVRALLRDGESVIAVEFETWSALGPGVDAEWLRARGH